MCKRTEPDKVVASVGSCNKDGKCSVQWTDGTFGTAYLPMVGMTVRINPKCIWVPSDSVKLYQKEYPE